MKSIATIFSGQQHDHPLWPAGNSGQLNTLWYRSALALDSIWRRIVMPVAFILTATSSFSATEEDAADVVVQSISQITYMLEGDLPIEQVHAGIEDMFANFADTVYISKTSLGRPWLRMTPAQRRLYSRVFQGYLARKYAVHFPKFIGGDYEIVRSRTIADNRSHEIVTRMHLKNRPPFPVYWRLVEVDGQPRIRNIIVDDLNLLALEKKIVRVLLEKSRGDINILIRTIANR